MSYSSTVIAELSGYDAANWSRSTSSQRIRDWTAALQRAELNGDFDSGRAVIGVYVNTDQTEGRGPMTLIGLFSNVDAADKAATNMGVMGIGDGDKKLMRVFGSTHEFVMTLPNNDRRKQEVLANDEDYQTFLKLRDRFGE